MGSVRLRLFPVMIFVAVLSLSIKVGDFVDGLATIGGSVSVASLQAQQATPEEAAPEQAAEGDAGDGAEGGDPVAGEAETAGEGGDGQSANALLDELGADEIEPDNQFTDAEISVLQDLKARREALDSRGKELELREQMIRAAEHTLESKIDEWKLLKTEVEGLLREYDTQQDEDLKRLAAYYERMKPKDAARIFNELEMKELLAIVERMKDSKASAVIAEMDTGKATSLTTELAARSPVSVPDGSPVASN
ncbi:MAG: hypothetical protein CMM50_04755 [Rhodospirillaceae bacterium]|mgnify:CR=1 FL=1|nr:hypothetical protein [Rhodospirillaceae bacterium]|tara:strand:+ start:546 stop:1298 length:753 start_codon:yes stop_codon:yes gene_type:complete